MGDRDVWVAVPANDGDTALRRSRARHHRGTTMEHYVGIDVSLEHSSVGVVDETGKIVVEAKVVSEPEALIAWLRRQPFTLARIGLEAGPLSQWLFAGLRDAGFAAELLETRHVRDAFKAMPVKTGKKDARGIAQLMRLGWFKPVHGKSVSAQETRALLTARKLLQAKRHDVEMSLRGVLRGFGLKVGPTTPRTFEARVRELVDGHPTLVTVAEALLAALKALVLRGPKLERDGCVAWHVRDLRDLVERRFGVGYSESGMLRLLHGLDLSWQKARPVHPEADAKAQEGFKKACPR